MKKIVILTSGDARSTEKIVALFNEGNRIHTDIIFTDAPNELLETRLKELGCTTFYLNEQTWQEKNEEIINIVEEQKPEIIVLDGWKDSVPEELAKIAGYHVVMVTSPEEAPKEVVNAIESINISSPRMEELSSTEKSMDEEWAETLQINFEKPRRDDTPPPLPPEETVTQDEFPQTPPEIPETNYPKFNRDQWIKEPKNYSNEEAMPPTYLIWSVLCTVFCCFIPGIVAIIFSSQVSSKYFAGDIEGAKRSSRIAEIWIIVSFILGVLTATLYLPIMLIN